MRFLPWSGAVRVLDTVTEPHCAEPYTVYGQFGIRANAIKGREPLKKLADGVRSNRRRRKAKGVVRPVPLRIAAAGRSVDVAPQD
jgi:hypothetical protein